MTTALRAARVAQRAFLAVEAVHALRAILALAARGASGTLRAIPVAVTIAMGCSVAVQRTVPVRTSDWAAFIAMLPRVARIARALPAHLIALCTFAAKRGALALNAVVRAGVESICACAARLGTVKARLALARAVLNVRARSNALTKAATWLPSSAKLLTCTLGARL